MYETTSSNTGTGKATIAVTCTTRIVPDAYDTDYVFVETTDADGNETVERRTINPLIDDSRQ